MFSTQKAYNQIAQKQPYGFGATVNMHEVSYYLFHPFSPIPTDGGNGTVIGSDILNDTGSDIMTLSDFDVRNLGDLSHYTGYLRNITFSCANGSVDDASRAVVRVF